ncbi:MAG: ADP-forming succinate--CoA ligase subunit beta [Bdellovibrionaceae bacterium]|nr:ADP-forming succinate--CoA ligase subunit beta [Pseudobdellovibrionaceae bacterium]
MNIHEHQGKELFRKFNLPVPNGYVAYSADEAVKAAESLGGSIWVVKAQIHAGGRGKGGGVKVAKSKAEVAEYAKSMLGMQLVTHQTGPEGKEVKRLLIEEGAAIAKELYLAVTLDRAKAKLVVMASTEGGMDIEKVAHETPEKIFKIWISPVVGLRSFQSRSLGQKLGLSGNALKQFPSFLSNLVKLYQAYDCSLVEINPLILTQDGNLVALDAKLNFDDNALFRHADILELRDPNEEDANEAKAKQFDLSYISLDGNIGCMVNGAGLAMATMDIIKLEGGDPANFLDVGGGATEEKVREAFKIILGDTKVRAVLVNIFGGIMKCDVIAAGVVGAARELGIKIPVVVRLEGTNVDKGKKILEESGLKLITATGMKEAAKRVVEAAK